MVWQINQVLLTNFVSVMFAENEGAWRFLSTFQLGNLVAYIDFERFANR